MPGWALDIGCGCGGNSIVLAKKGFHVVALDKRSEALECLKQRIRKHKVRSRIHPKILNVNTTLFPKRNYSLILALNVLHFLPPKRARFLIAQLKKSLEPGEILFIKIFSNKNKPRDKGYYPSITSLRNELPKFHIKQLKHYLVEDNHSPIGFHRHWVIDLIARKNSSELDFSIEPAGYHNG